MRFDRTYVRAAIEEGDHSDWETIKVFLSYLGYDIKFVHVAISPAIPLQSKTNIIYFPARGTQGLNTKRGVYHPSPLA